MERRTPQPRKTKIEDQSVPWTERVARARPTVPIRRLSAGQEPHARSESAIQRRVESNWEGESHATGSKDSNGTELFGLPATITQRAENLHDFEPEPNRLDDDYERWAIAAPEGSDVDDRTDHEFWDYTQAYRTDIDMIPGNFHEQEAHEEPQDSDLDIPISERVRNAFAIHAIIQAGRGGSQNETPDLFGPKRLRLTQRPRFRIHGHQASLWLTNYEYGSFLGLAEALTLHEQETFGYHSGSKDRMGRIEFVPFVAEIRMRGKWTGKVKFKGNPVADQKAYLRAIRPVIDEGDPEAVIWVHTDALECTFECDCYEPGELVFEAPDHGSLRVTADWGEWQQKAVSNSLVFDNSFLTHIFVPQTFTDRSHYQISLPDGQTFRVSWNGVDATKSPTLTNEVQEALSGVAASVTKDNIVQNRITIQLVRGSFEGLQLDRPEGVSNPQSPSEIFAVVVRSSHTYTFTAQARARGTVFVYRPARPTSFKYDPPYTIMRFLALVREHLYPDTPENKLRIMISPNTVARDEGSLLTPIAEVAGGHSKEMEYVWGRNYVTHNFNPYEDVWAIKIFDSIKVYDGRNTGDESNGVEWDARGLSQGKSFYKGKEKEKKYNIELIGARIEVMNILAEISKTLLGIDPRASREGIILHVRRPGQAREDKEWLKWSARHTFNDFLMQILYKIDGDEIAIYPPEYTEPNISTAMNTIVTAEYLPITRQPPPAENPNSRAKVEAERDRLRALHQPPPGFKPGFDTPYHVGGAGYAAPLARFLREFAPIRHVPDLLPEDSRQRQLTDTTVSQATSNMTMGLESIRRLRAESEALQREDNMRSIVGCTQSNLQSDPPLRNPKGFLLKPQVNYHVEIAQRRPLTPGKNPK
ncbi:MAG: hypothetical protein Q9174_003283 [Haloplaca sp. 1 TL-2023]